MKRLIINTANDELDIVLQLEEKVFCKTSNSKMHHNETMLPLIDELLGESKIDIKDIDEFGVVIGPGSFTGIRVGVATVKAFRDGLGGVAKGINNLDYLFSLAVKQNPEVKVVAILGSKDSYFVARNVNGILYKYERNLTLYELKNIAKDSPVGMFKPDENLNYFVVKFDPKILIDCFEKSQDTSLVPVYYQLSQAENEKIKKGNVEIKEATAKDLDAIYEIEKENIKVNTLTKEYIDSILKDKNYKIFVTLFNEKIVGFIILQITDEINIDSIAVDKQYRNIGLATKLIARAEQFALDIGINTISLEVRKRNITAYLLYEKLGFKIRRERKGYYQDGDDCLEMVKQLN